MSASLQKRPGCCAAGNDAKGQKQKSANPDSIGALARNRTKGDTKTSMQDCSNQSGNPSSSTLSGAGRVEEARQAYAEMMHNYPDLLRYIQRAFGRSWSA